MEKLFFNLVKDSFTQKRKTLRNNLKQYDLDKIEQVLNKYNFDLSNLSLKELIEVYENITNFLDYLENHKIEIETKEEK